MGEFVRLEIGDGIGTIRLDRPPMNALNTQVQEELRAAALAATADAEVRAVVVYGGEKVFAAGADIKEMAAMSYVDMATRAGALSTAFDAIARIPKPVVAMVDGYCIGGGHVLHVLCDLTIASSRAKFGQTGPKVGSFDAGFGSIQLARMVGQKRAREIWYLCRQYTAEEAYDMGLVNKVVPAEQLEEETKAWCREMLSKSPSALRFLKYSFNADTDYVYGLQAIAHGATSLFYTTEESKEGRRAFIEKRQPDFSKYRQHPW